RRGITNTALYIAVPARWSFRYGNRPRQRRPRTGLSPSRWPCVPVCRSATPSPERGRAFPVRVSGVATMRLNGFRLRRPAARRPGFRPLCEALEERWVPTTPPPGFREADVARALTMPTALAVVPDGSGRIFITQQTGQVRVYDPFRGLLPTPFLSVATTTSGERGLEGLVFDPDHLSNGYGYIYYTPPTAPIHNRVTRWTTDPANPDVALAGSEQIIISLPNLSTATNHNGGGLGFSADGTLFITTGENANSSLAQNFNSLLGKVLRIDVTR